ncbi:hypothetical protein [Streptomyces clavifer]|uniref:hypothetical protein n=1 Tax=Streptomyces clavifer TaxID=68188 RepID=UPI003087B1D2|nr:hypothetical protein OG388_22580 [Streptomyces clavifer]
MADEQDEWLDADVAENLLRGDPVEPVDDHARNAARRLEAALREVRAPGPPGGELPGEAAVMAAFREASGARTKRDGGARAAGPGGHQDTLHTVRIDATRAPSSRRPRWTRPVRYGLAVSLAGCALGGVAVAGGTGMLPAPFGGQGSPAPASSVSVAASPEELGAEVPEAGGPSSAPASPDVSASPTAPEGADRGTDPDDGRSRPGGGTAGGTDRRSGDPDREGTPESTPDGTDGHETPDGSAGGKGADLHEKAARACRDYRSDDLSREDERRLLDLADGEDNLARFCDRVLEDDDADGSGGGSGDGSGGPDGGKGPGEDGEESLPSISFRTPPPEGGTNQRSTAGAPADEPSALSPAAR